MTLSRILILNRSENALSQAFYFALKHFGNNSNQLVILLDNEVSLELENLVYDEAKHMRAENLRVLKITKKTVAEVKNQLFFSDILVADSADFSYVSSLYEKNKSCSALHPPCFIVPENTDVIHNVVLLNNTSESSIQTIKLFCNLFKGFCELWEVSLLDLTADEIDEALLMQQKLLVQYLKIHCPKLAVHRYRGEDTEKLRKLLEIKSNSLLVTGGELHQFDLEFILGEVKQAYIYQPMLK